jgi:D-glycero-D-manno-heptose 1,7-bisphosphate phosphatase
MSRAAVFLDRDGTLVDELGYLTDPDRVRLLPGAVEAVRALNEGGVPVFVITNQSGVARGLLTEERLAAIHARLAALLAKGGARVDAVYYCPHHPSEGSGPYRRECECRKPSPGMLRRAADEHGLDLARSFVVGDQPADVETARRAGAQAVTVLTGWGGRSPGGGEDAGPHPDFTAPGVHEAALWAIARLASLSGGE